MCFSSPEVVFKTCIAMKLDDDDDDDDKDLYYCMSVGRQFSLRLPIILLITVCRKKMTKLQLIPIRFAADFFHTLACVTLNND